MHWPAASLQLLVGLASAMKASVVTNFGVFGLKGFHIHQNDCTIEPDSTHSLKRASTSLCRVFTAASLSDASDATSVRRTLIVIDP